MKITTRHEGEAEILELSGDITLYNTPEVRKAILGLLKDKRAPELLVDMHAVRYIDSSGVASLVEGLKASRDLNSRFALYGLTKTTREVLELTRLMRVFEVYDTEEQALAGKPKEDDRAREAGNG
ncbi:MAG TPA: STAS domain-containing protein [Candidatus Acidoferrales bacterium]|nr:STAS domain-containing protein [Candidatus Acidoferrales bacterium]